MNDDDLKKKIIDGIKQDYFLLKKAQWMNFLGGFIAFFVTIGVINYQVASQKAKDVAKEIVTDEFVQEITNYKQQAKDSLSETQAIETKANKIFSDLNNNNKLSEIDENLDKITNELEKVQASSVKVYSKSVVFGKTADGQLINGTVDSGHRDYAITPNGAKRVVAAWWSLQDDASNSDALKQFSIGGTSGSDNDIVTINGSSAIFRVRKASSNPGLIRVLFYVLYM